MNGTQTRARRGKRLTIATVATGGVAIGAILLGALPANAAAAPNPAPPAAAPPAAVPPAPAPAPPAPPTATSPTCTYTVTRNGAPVYAAANGSTPVVATLNAGNIVTSPQPCGGADFVQVNLLLGGVGWMRALDLAGGH